MKVIIHAMDSRDNKRGIDRSFSFDTQKSSFIEELERVLLEYFDDEHKTLIVTKAQEIKIDWS